MSRPRVSIIGLMVIAALAVAGCGSSAESSSSKNAASKASSPSYSESATSSAATSSAATEASKSESESGYGYGESETAATKSASSGVAVVKTKSNKVYGEVLAAGSEEHTVYMFAKDKGGTSSCSGACASVWPPLITTGSPKAEGKALAAKLGTITRSNGEKQVTYAGHPLYYYVSDKTASDVVGEGVVTFGAPWYILSPAGKVIKKA